MNDKKILVINTFPIKRAQTGGEKRVQAIIEAYNQISSEVFYTSVFYQPYYPVSGALDVPLPDSLTPQVHASPHTVDVLCGESIFADPQVKERMSTILQNINPDIIQIEQAYPYIGLKPLLAELGMKPKLILSSHNVESLHKRDILEDSHMPKSQIDKIIEKIADAELDLTKHSEFVVACTESDAAYYKKHGAKKVVVARNGMAQISATEAAIDHWKNFFKKRDIEKTALFVGAAHPPNWIGLEQAMGFGLGFLPANTRLLLAGGISTYLQDVLKQPYNIEHETFWLRAIALGRPSDDRLGALLKLCDVILLPLTEGGGSNLKTAEAILADKPIVGTTHAFRSFESLKNLPNIYIADTPDEFRKSMIKAMNTPQQERTAEQQKQAESVLWENTLKSMVEETAKI